MKYIKRIGQKTGRSIGVNDINNDKATAVKLLNQNFFSDNLLINGLYSLPLASGNNGSSLFTTCNGVKNDINWNKI